MSSASSSSSSSAPSLAQRLKSFDLYRDIPKDLTEQTTSGAIISVSAFIFIAYLFLGELLSFLSPSISHTMFVDHPTLPHLFTTSAFTADSTPDSYDLLTINLNISFPSLPCTFASLDVQDVVGSHVEDVGGAVHKTRMDSATNALKFDHFGNPVSGEHMQGNADGEGCNFSGHVIVKKVPGNLHISAHSHPEAGHGWGGHLGDINVSHVIHSLYFGDDDSLLRIPSAVTQPLAGSVRIARPMSATNAYGQAMQAMPSYEYYLKLVPTQSVGMDGTVRKGFQYIAHSNAVAGRYRIAAVYLRFDVDAVTVRFERKSKSFSHFIVQLCAIIGGVFTVLGMLNGVVLTASKTLKKQQIGKLG